MKRHGATRFPAKITRLAVILLLGFLVHCPLVPIAMAATKTLSGKLRGVQDKILTIEEKKGLGTALVEVETDSQTKVTGELTPGMIIKLRYREEKAQSATGPPEDSAIGKDDATGKGDTVAKDDAKDGIRRIATEIKTWPEYSSRRDRKAAPVTQP
jgi:hypothetical protein